jgi:hypothetical protein
VNSLFPWKQYFPQIIDFIEDFLDSKHCDLYNFFIGAGWSSPVARWAHNPKVDGSNPSKALILSRPQGGFFNTLRVTSFSGFIFNLLNFCSQF